MCALGARACACTQTRTHAHTHTHITSDTTRAPVLNICTIYNICGVCLSATAFSRQLSSLSFFRVAYWGGQMHYISLQVSLQVSVVCRLLECVCHVSLDGTDVASSATSQRPLSLHQMLRQGEARAAQHGVRSDIECDLMPGLQDQPASHSVTQRHTASHSATSPKPVPGAAPLPRRGHTARTQVTARAICATRVFYQDACVLSTCATRVFYQRARRVCFINTVCSGSVPNGNAFPTDDSSWHVMMCV